MNTEDEYRQEEAYEEIVRSVELESKSFFDVTTEINAVDYLEQSVRFLLEADKNHLAWKWVVISLHGALYGFCISALRGTNPSLVKEKKSENIISFGKALGRCQELKYLKMGGSLADTPLTLTEKQRKAIQLIHQKFRNNFEHFPPMTMSLASLDIAENVSCVFEVIEYLVFNTKSFIHRIDSEEHERIRSLCVSGKQLSASMNTKLNKYIEEYNRIQEPH